MSMVQMYKATRRNTPCHWVHVADVKILFSYQTPVALQYYGDDGIRCTVRRRNIWGPTTGRHMHECGVRNWVEVSEKTINQRMEAAIVRTFAERSAAEFAKILVDKLPEGRV